MICHANGTAVGYYFDVSGTGPAWTCRTCLHEKIREMQKLHVCLEEAFKKGRMLGGAGADKVRVRA